MSYGNRHTKTMSLWVSVDKTSLSIDARQLLRWMIHRAFVQNGILNEQDVKDICEYDEYVGEHLKKYVQELHRFKFISVILIGKTKLVQVNCVAERTRFK